MFDLTDKIALVTGASRGVGKGITLGLAEANTTVYVTGRTTEPGEGPEGLPGTVLDTAREAGKLGGKVIAVPCDHRDDSQVRRVFDRIFAEQEHLDILVNNVWGGYEGMAENGKFTWSLPFWEQPLSRWDKMFQAGVRAHYVAGVLAARDMVRRKRGLIINISFWSAQKLIGNVPYGVAKAATDKLTVYMAQELRPYNVAVISLYPGLVRTESVMRAAEFLDLSNSESPQFIGRAVAALASDPDIMKHSGKVSVAAAIAREYGFTDIDGRQPEPLTPDTV
ncbi:SDR family NAD(P)-dependent oxidoreductase [Dehalogenimonas etheniformans]|uniref:Short-chain dehydrogenase n=1 Tax=Dehalogenimonas etheniformans TaxID=1536648 RepID=A0A2P5P8D0_9CHLR|nr:SDR family NAD(P)-dependent oxidoreductase [Dehalogenimonas etheniformans]PPD58554.1 short-chain dehydrogenase [Dehalogenimonas etheniformans]QNT76682.1 SDR family NAD(P)-dependent oxidoreductase [Dehalogenimonas etheniformans]